MADDNLAALLAGSAKTNANYNLDEINKSYWEGLDQAYKRRTQDAFLNIQNDPSLKDDKGNIDPEKMYLRGLQVSGVPGAENADKLATGADRLGGYRDWNALQRRLNPPLPPSINPSASPRGSAGPTSYANPDDDGSISPAPSRPVQSRPPPPPQAAGPFTQFLTAQGVPPEQQQNEALKIQQGFMQLTGRPFDTSKGLNLADNDTRQVLGKYVLSRAGQGQQPQAGMATQVGPNGIIAPQQGGQPAPLQAAPQTAPAAIQQNFPLPPAAAQGQPLGPQTMMLSPEARDAMAQVQPAQGASFGIDPESLKNMIPANILRAGGGTVAGTLNLLSEIVNSRAPAERKASYVKLYNELTEQLKLTEPQRNAQTPGPISAAERSQTTAKQDAELYAKKYQAIQDQGDKSRGEVPQLEMLQEQMKDPNFYSGAGAKYALLYARLKSAVGMDPNAAVPQEFLRKATAQNVLASLGQLKGLGPIRVPEMNMAREAAASPDNSVPANQLLVEISKRTHERYDKIAELAQEYKLTHGSLDPNFDRQVSTYYKNNPMFTDAEIKNWQTVIRADKAKIGAASQGTLKHPENGRSIAPNPDPKTNKTNPYIYVD